MKIQLSNQELEANEDRTQAVYSCKKVASFEEGPVEFFADEIIQVSNNEVIYTDLFVQLYFNMDNLPSQKIFNEEALEASPLDTPANYRTRFQVSIPFLHLINPMDQVFILILQDASCAFLGAKYKWESLRSGSLAQRLPDFTPGREFISLSRADLLKVTIYQNNNSFGSNIRFRYLTQRLKLR